MTVSEWLKSMQAVGFEGTFTATNEEEKYKGIVTKDGIKAKRLKTHAESRAEFKQMREKLGK